MDSNNNNNRNRNGNNNNNNNNLADSGTGRSTELFPDGVDDELICSLCLNVFVDPSDTPCEHVYCNACITESLKRYITYSILNTRYFYILYSIFYILYFLFSILSA